MRIRSLIPDFFDFPIRFAFMSSGAFKRSLIPALFMTLLFVAGCDSGDVVEQDVAQVQVRLELENLPPLQDGFSYQAFARVGVEFHATDKFNVTENGSFVNAAGQFIQNSLTFPVDVSGASEILVTIEDKRDSNEEPSGTVVFAGDVSDSQATLTQAHERALGTSLSGQSGSFMLMNHASDALPNDVSGLWFVQGSKSAPTAGLSLPTLPDGWRYEGWIEVGGVLVSTGAFRENNAPDAARLYSNTDTPRFPGEDFQLNAPEGVTFPLNPASGTVHVTVEPFPDDTVEPFGFFVMSGSVPANPAAETAYPLSANLIAPSGTATLF